jgi:hypothetical protein
MRPGRGRYEGLAKLRVGLVGSFGGKKGESGEVVYGRVVNLHAGNQDLDL